MSHIRLYNTFEEIVDAKRRNCKKSYIKKKIANAEFIAQKQYIREALKDKTKTLIMYEVLINKYPELNPSCPKV